MSKLTTTKGQSQQTRNRDEVGLSFTKPNNETLCAVM